MSRSRMGGIREVRPGVYLIRVQRTDPRTGKPIDERRRVKCATLADAVAAQKRMLDEIEHGDQRRERVRLKDYASSWLTGRLPTLKPSTRARYAESLDRHILPQFGDFYLDAIDPEDVRSWFSEKASGSAPSTANGYLRLLKSVMADAVADYNLQRDPTRRIRAMPERSRNDDGEPINILRADEMNQFLAALRTRWPQWHALVFTQLCGALRFGEVSALRWEDIDEKRGVLKIRRAQWRTCVSTVKTERPKEVGISDELRHVLQDWRQRLVKSQHRHLGSGWIFPSEAGKPHHNASCMRRAFVDCLKVIGVERRFSSHGLRRTANDLLRRVASSEVTRAITGHVTEEMTQHYSHVDEGEKRTAMNRVLKLIHGGKAKRARSSERKRVTRKKRRS